MSNTPDPKDDLAGWDGGQASGSKTDDDGHTVVYGTIDGEHHSVSYNEPGSKAEAEKGTNQHDTLATPSNGGWWTVDSESGKEKEK